MEYLVFYIIGGIVIISIISWVSQKYQEAENRRRQRNLDQIAYEMLSDFDFNKEKEEIRSIVSQYVPEAYRCPKCNGILVLRRGIYGEFFGCNRYPECDFFSLAEETGKSETIGAQDVYKIYKASRCPKCNGMLVLRDGIYGKFLGCSSYPRCKYTRSI